jgi:hypothetical protein
MDQMLIAYLILAGITIFVFIIFILKIAGQDILFSLFRYFQPRGAEIFIVNPDRQISRFYKTSKDGYFRINGFIYITNPNKLMGLTEEMKRDVKLKMSLGYARLQKGIDKLEQQRQIIANQLKAIEKNEELLNDPQIIITLDNYKVQLQELNNRIELLKSRQQQREQAFYLNRRPAYFYIDGDPVPKDFYEWLTEIDNQALENIIVRAQTRDPRAVANLEQSIVWIKRFILFVLIVSVIGAILTFKNGAFLDQIGQKIGVAFKL